MNNDGWGECFADGSMSITGYVCLVESSITTLLPVHIITTSRERALYLKQEHGYDIYSIQLLKKSEGD